VGTDLIILSAIICWISLSTISRIWYGILGFEISRIMQIINDFN
jgi:hypothetical protein